MKTLHVIAILISSFSFSLQAQVIELGRDTTEQESDKNYLADLYKQSDVIVEGKVIFSRGFADPKSSAIYTSSKVVIYKLFKGTTNKDTIEVVVRGGIIIPPDSAPEKARSLSISHTHPLQDGEEGIFFLKKRDSEIRLFDAYDNFTLYSDSRIGFFHDKFSPAARFRSIWLKDVQKELYPLLRKLWGKNYIEVNPNPNLKSN